MADCLRCWGPLISVPIADAALHRGVVTPEEIGDQLSRMLRWTGSPRARESLRLVDGRRESWLESYANVLFDEWLVPLPEPQVTVRDPDHTFVGRVDGGWLEDLTVLELDGEAKYDLASEDGVVDPTAVWRQEKSRFDGIGNLGLSGVRLGLGDLLTRRPMVVREIRDARVRGSRSHFSGTFHRTDPTGLTCLSVIEARTPRKR